MILNEFLNFLEKNSFFSHNNALLIFTKTVWDIAEILGQTAFIERTGKIALDLGLNEELSLIMIVGDQLTYILQSIKYMLPQNEMKYLCWKWPLESNF